MATPAPRGQRPGNSPFDEIMKTESNPDGTTTEWWSAREAMELLGYSNWQNMQNVIRKAKAACRNSGHSVAEHFTDISETTAQGGPRRQDTLLRRFGMYLVAMNGDPDKAEIAAAQRYFAIQTRRAELNLPPIVPPVIPVFPASQLVPPTQPRPWYERVRETWMPHIRLMNREHPDGFTVVTELAMYVMQMEDELQYHEVVTRSTDRPDISISSRWSRYRREVLGYADVAASPLALLYLPDQDITVELKVYPDSERNAFRKWFFNVYLLEAYLAYIDNKKEWKRDVPELTRASVADQTCQAITGRAAALPAPRRAALTAALPPAGGRVPTSRALPGVRHPRPQLPSDN